jgi:hypothetical protein
MEGGEESQVVTKGMDDWEEGVNSLPENRCATYD